MRDFVCPDCGEIIKNDTSSNRKRCPRCSYAAQKQRVIDFCRQRRIQMREDNKIRKKAGRKPKEKPEPLPAVRLQKQAEAEQNARVREQKKQCKNCRWRMYDTPNNRVLGCEYLLRNGHMRDRGEGPGKCGSFEPIKNLKERSSVYVQKGKAE